MKKEANAWERPRYSPGGGDALIFYLVYGTFPEIANVSNMAYRVGGLPKGVEVRKITKVDRTVLPFCDDESSAILSSPDPKIISAARQADECLILSGTVKDPGDLKYLRESIGFIIYLVENGGVAVLDAQQFRLFSPTEWHRNFFESDEPNVFRHISILFSEEEVGPGRWYHTRGMRKFGRPDFSIRNVPSEYEDVTVKLCNRFIELQALGGIVPEGQEIRMSSLPAGLICHHKGNLDDPDFNNVHIEVRFPRC